MTDPKAIPPAGTDWTRLLADPELVRNLGKLLQTYRDAPPDRREQALLAAMQQIKQGGSVDGIQPSAQGAPTTQPLQPVPAPATSVPPFEPDLFSPIPGQDRRQHPRIKCFVAVELRVNDADAPIWGNLSNTSLGGCLVETASPVTSGAKVEIGLWLASGKIWVKGFVLSGVVTRSGPASGVRVRFDSLEANGREALRQFLKYVQETTRASNNEGSYLQLLK
ncbi:MAG TPA: PilZ domain-containing protein [Candidatus Aquilonibacter sp.]|nr:PilZ domain-containing protein [Candidatus Aquilonibacter sp.]